MSQRNYLKKKAVKNKSKGLFKAFLMSQVKIDPDLHIGSESIGRVSSTKTLGVLINENITWHNYIDYVAKKSAKRIGLLRRSVDMLESNTLRPTLLVL